MMTNITKKRYVLPALALTLIFSLGMLCSCGSSASDDTATDASAEKATVTAGEAAAQADGNEKATTQKKTGTEDPAIDAAKAKATKEIKGFDGSWENLSIDVDDPITTIDFDWKGTHYQYKYDQKTNEIIE